MIFPHGTEQIGESRKWIQFPARDEKILAFAERTVRVSANRVVMNRLWGPGDAL